MACKCMSAENKVNKDKNILHLCPLSLCKIKLIKSCMSVENEVNKDHEFVGQIDRSVRRV